MRPTTKNLSNFYPTPPGLNSKVTIKKDALPSLVSSSCQTADTLLVLWPSKKNEKVYLDYTYIFILDLILDIFCLRK